ncbi:D-aminoacyl-tRNA deacylase [Alteromonas sp. KUL49]|uniref:D-aminoacyl-tRNA deacylase n=1 Tax=Alteromonas sp. KUL49 TaxID=2480798 RepID=UPI00102F25D2|nr:D-aminoacyl-tRNA deacylase [Alteromonas sp. KUL49]TAP37967.1 D-tyrosyl-tRNA(Tyr) deacylase [Alteromonas sp. KUL49]GEA12838.1 D-aminoacyl-tRNA deacylase [Alteromonas sp. KUL49]
MIGLIQRVSEASVSVNNEVVGNIGHGMLVLLGVEKSDNDSSIEKLANKLSRYRMFSDSDGKMNLNIEQVGGEILVVSQFTLVADTQKGNRPGFSRGATPEHGEQIYNQFVSKLKSLNMAVQTGQFGADMQVALINDGPVTFQFQV